MGIRDDGAGRVFGAELSEKLADNLATSLTQWDSRRLFN